MSAEDTGRPYTEIREGNLIRRTFSKDIDSEELKWHRDQHDRKVTIIKSGNWQFQRDNKLPLSLEDGQSIFIPRESWHRVIKGDDDLVIEIEELKDEYN